MSNIESAIDIIVQNIVDKKTNATQVQSIITKRLISLSKTKKKVLINVTFGGYSIPKEFQEYILETSGNKLDSYCSDHALNSTRELAGSNVESYGKHVFPSIQNAEHRLTLTLILMTALRYSRYSKDKDKIKNDLLESYQTYPLETLKKDSDLEIVEVPELVDYHIHEYDGRERIIIGVDLNQD